MLPVVATLRKCFDRGGHVRPETASIEQLLVIHRFVERVEHRVSVTDRGEEPHGFRRSVEERPGVPRVAKRGQQAFDRFATVSGGLEDYRLRLFNAIVPVVWLEEVRS